MDAQPGEVSNAAATLTSKDQTTDTILTEREDLPIQVPTKYLSSTLDFYSCGIWPRGEHLMKIPFYSGPPCMPGKLLDMLPAAPL